jgi:hypothetical protein
MTYASSLIFGFKLEYAVTMSSNVLEKEEKIELTLKLGEITARPPCHPDLCSSLEQI